MATIEKISVIIAELEKKHGENIPLQELRQSVAQLFEGLPDASSASQAKPAGEQCCAMTKAKDPKQCSKTGVAIGSDDKHYCTMHFKTAFPELAAALPVKEKKPATEGAKKPTAPKATAGKGSMNPTCDHDISGKNPRKCTSAGKVQAGGKWYCGTHSKSHTGGAGTKSNDASASSKIAKSTEMEAPSILMNEELGLAVDQNGLCYVNDYEGKGISVVGRLTGNVVVDITSEDETFCKKTDLPLVPLEGRLKIIAMTPKERDAQFMQESA